MIPLVTVNPLLSKKLLQQSLHEQHLIHLQQCDQLVNSFKDKINPYTRKELRQLRVFMKLYLQMEPMLLIKDYLYQINKQLKAKSL